MAWAGVLAQGGGGGGLGALLGGPPPPPLPAAPLWERWLLEEPLVPALAVLAAAGVALWLMNRAGDARRGVVVAALLAGIGAGVFVLAAVITTERERLTAATAELVGSVARADERATGSLLAPDARLSAGRFSELGRDMTRDQILSFVAGEMSGMYKVENYRIMDTQAAADGPNAARTHTHVRVTPERSGGVFFSWWRLDWRREPDGRWLVTGIEPLEAGEQ